MDSVKKFFSYLFGYHFYEIMRNRKTWISIIFLIVLSLVVTICWVIPKSTTTIKDVNDYVYLYDESCPEIHLHSGGAKLVGTLPHRIEMNDGRVVLFDTTGCDTSIYSLPVGSIIITQEKVLWNSKANVEELRFSEMKLMSPVEITPANISALKNSIYVWGIIIITLFMFLLFTMLIMTITWVGSGYCILIDSFLKGQITARSSFVLAVFTMTPFALFLGASFVYDIPLGGKRMILLLFYAVALLGNLLLDRQKDEL